MPFWKGDAADRTVQFGERIGALIRELSDLPPAAAIRRLVTRHDLDQSAAENLLQYLGEQQAATDAIPTDRSLIIERTTDELGDWRICVLSPFGGKVHAPWAMGATAKIRHELALDVEAMWSDDGFIIRFPESDAPPDTSLVIPSAAEIEALVIEQLGASALFAAKFREAAARALLLPRRRAGTRTPLWQQRKRAADLLQVAAQYGSFPMLLEAYRECIRDVFDVPALIETLAKIEKREISITTVDTERPSPFAASLLFRYVANYIYDGDAPLAERRAQALAIDQNQLRELLGDAQLRELLDGNSIDQVERELQAIDVRYQARNADAIHDLLLRIGDLTMEQIVARVQGVDPHEAITALSKARRVVTVSIGGETRLIAVEDSSRYRDALGAPIPNGIPERFLESVKDPMADLVLRFARTHGPFMLSDIAQRYGTGEKTIEPYLARLVARGRVLEGEFRPTGTRREWCEGEVLKHIRRRSLAKIRKEVEPVDPRVAARLLTTWQGVTRKKRGLDALLEVIETLQGCPLPASILESEILFARIDGYQPSQLDTLTAAGEVVWAGVESLGERDGRIALYLTDHFRTLHQPRTARPLSESESEILDFLSRNGASLFAEIDSAMGGFKTDILKNLWNLVWQGQVVNDSFHPLRAFTRPKSSKLRSFSGGRGFRSRRSSPAGSEGRWSLPAAVESERGTVERRAAALGQQLLTRYGIVSREVMNVESVQGGFSAVYDVLKLMEEGGRIRRGYFVEGVAANQFATPAALDLLRSLRTEPDLPESVLIAATDPANPYGNVLAWPALPSGRSPSRSVGASVIMVNGALACYMSRGEKQIQVFLPEEEPSRSLMAREVANVLANLVATGRRKAMLLAEVNGASPADHPIAPFLLERKFIPTAMGFHLRGERSFNARKDEATDDMDPDPISD